MVIKGNATAEFTSDLTGKGAKIPARQKRIIWDSKTDNSKLYDGLSDFLHSMKIPATANSIKMLTRSL